jgi:NADH-quinone oxidoreductase subunit C
MSKTLVELVKKEFPAAVLETHSLAGDETVVVDASSWKDVARFLKDDARADMAMLVDLTAVDYPERKPRFEVVVHFYSLTKGHRLRLKTRVGDSEGGGRRARHGLRPLGERELGGARVLRHVRRRVPRPPRLAPHPHVPRVRGAPPPARLPGRPHPAARPYREIPNIDKIAPFGPDEGMPFGRQTHAHGVDEDAS